MHSFLQRHSLCRIVWVVLGDCFRSCKPQRQTRAPDAEDPLLGRCKGRKRASAASTFASKVRIGFDLPAWENGDHLPKPLNLSKLTCICYHNTSVINNLRKLYGKVLDFTIFSRRTGLSFLEFMAHHLQVITTCCDDQSLTRAKVTGGWWGTICVRCSKQYRGPQLDSGMVSNTFVVEKHIVISIWGSVCVV